MNSPAGRTRASAIAPLLAAFAICAAAALWISEGVGLWDADVHNAWHHYEYLAEGFVHGHTYLSLQPDPELLALRDPYDPGANVGHKLWDASLYRGKYYLYFGPAPALLMLPWRIATGHEPPQRLVVAAAAVAELAALALLLWDLRRRYFPGVSPVGLGAILLVAFHASWLPVLLRRSAVWELPIAGAVACLAWAVYFLWRFHASGGKARWALAGGAALALLIGCRATYLFSAAAVALLFFVPPAGGGEPARRIRATAILAGLVAFAGGVVLLLYNHERFGGWLDFGQSYQLWGKEYRGLHFFSPRFIPFNARTYLFSIPELGPYFPFIHPFAAENPPAGYMETEDIYGVLFTMPVQLAGLAACAWAWCRRADPAMRAGVVAVVASVGSSALSALVLFSFGGACSRYTAELLGGWTLATCIGLMAVFGSADGWRPGPLVRALAVLAACWTVACVWLASAEYRGYMKQTNPRVYGAFAHALDYPAEWWARGKGIRYGPVDLVVRIPSSAGDSRTVLMASGRPQMVNYLLLDKTQAGESRLILAWNEHHVLETPAIRAIGAALHLRIDAPWLYPPPDDPYWDGIADPTARGDRQTLFAITWDSGSVRINSPHFADPVTFEPTVLGISQAGPDSPAVESLRPAEPIP